MGKLGLIFSTRQHANTMLKPRYMLYISPEYTSRCVATQKYQSKLPKILPQFSFIFKTTLSPLLFAEIKTNVGNEVEHMY